MQGARRAATETYQIDRRGSAHRATPQMAHRSSFSTACYSLFGLVNLALAKRKLLVPQGTPAS